MIHTPRAGLLSSGPVRALSVCLPLSLLTACGALDPDDGTRALTGTTVSSWTGASVPQVTAHACVDDGKIHTSEWGKDCAVATATGDFEGGFRIEGLEPETYQLYLEGPTDWGDHATLVSLVAGNNAVAVEMSPSSVASIQVVGDYELSEPQLRFSVGDASECGSNELRVDLPDYDELILDGSDADACVEIENNDFVGKLAFIETFRPPVAGQCGDDWCEEWTVVSRTPRRRGTLLATLSFEDKEINLDGEWLE